MRSKYPEYLALALLTLSCESGDRDDIEPTITRDDGITATGASVLERNNSPGRTGVFVQPTLTKARAATMVLDRTFDGTVSGNVFASPLFVDGTPGVFVIATENNQISVLDENTGRPVWQRTYGTPAGRTGAGCGNISPLGITGTPVIDPAKR